MVLSPLKWTAKLLAMLGQDFRLLLSTLGSRYSCWTQIAPEQQREPAELLHSATHHGDKASP